jgi:hypothetical protein
VNQVERRSRPRPDVVSPTDRARHRRPIARAVDHQHTRATPQIFWMSTWYTAGLNRPRFFLLAKGRVVGTLNVVSWQPGAVPPDADALAHRGDLPLLAAAQRRRWRSASIRRWRRCPS